MNSAVLRAVPPIALAVAYPLLAHWATHDGGGVSAAIALLDLVALCLIAPLMQGKAWAWAATAGCAAGLAWLAQTHYPQMLLLAPPMLFVGFVAWMFWRSLRPPREPLITRIVAAMERCEPSQLPPPLYRYSRGLTAGWAYVMAALALANGVLAMIAVPDGVLARLGHTPPVAIGQEEWSLFANLLNYGIVGGFFVGEYALRRWLFPHRPYRHFFDFLRQMAALGPRFWRGLFD
ncbi:ketosynthase [Lysobacter sp. MMG2]|uniref:ketosynthase n=1 Tax=Lysobacter sp. MMG2 TaxID=2801338 RepID=UPI0031F30722